MIAPALGFTPLLRTDGPVDSLVSAELRPHLLAVVRETLSNVARHAQATSAQVLLQVGDEIVLTVSDDGAGHRGGSRESGLRNMRERAESFGGSFRMQPGPEGGTIAVWRVPVRVTVNVARAPCLGEHVLDGSARRRRATRAVAESQQHLRVPDHPELAGQPRARVPGSRAPA